MKKVLCLTVALMLLFTLAASAANAITFYPKKINEEASGASTIIYTPKYGDTISAEANYELKDFFFVCVSEVDIPTSAEEKTYKVSAVYDELTEISIPSNGFVIAYLENDSAAESSEDAMGRDSSYDSISIGAAVMISDINIEEGTLGTNPIVTIEVSEDLSEDDIPQTSGSQAMAIFTVVAVIALAAAIALKPFKKTR